MYTKKSLLQKVLCFAAAVFFVLAFVCMGIASAKADEQQAFTGEWYGENWELTNPGAEGIGYPSVPIQVKGTNNSTWSVLLYDAVTLEEGEGIEIAFTVNNAHGMNIITSFNETADYAGGSATPWGGVSHWVFDQANQLVLNNSLTKEKVSLITSGVNASGVTDYTPKITKGGEDVTSDFGTNAKPGENLWSNWLPAETTLEPYDTRVSFRAVYRADGSSVIYARMAEDSDWAVVYAVQAGVGGTEEGVAVSPDSADKVFDSVAFTDKTNKASYPALAFQYAAWMNVYDFEITGLSVSRLDAEDNVVSTNYGTDNWAPYTNEYNFTFGDRYEMESSTDWSVFRMDEAVTLAEGEKLEINFMVSQPGSTFIMPSFNAVEVWENSSYTQPFGSLRLNFPISNGIGVNNVYWDYDQNGTPEYQPDII